MPDSFKEEIRTENTKEGRAEVVTPYEIIEQKPENPYFLELSPAALALGVTPSVLRNMIDQQPIESVRNALIYTKQAAEKKSIREKVDGYFVAAVKGNYTSKAMETEKKKSKKE